MRGATLWLGLATLCGAAEAVAAPVASDGERRVALLVGHPFGGEGLTPLRYVGNDVERLQEVLLLSGGFAADDVLVSFGEESEVVEDRFAEATARIQAHRARGFDTLFLFYYSGHAQDGALRLGESRLELTELKRLIDGTGAPLRIALLDSCRSGGITRLKGASKGEPVAVQVEDSSSQRGLVLITASSDDEDAQESDEINGSFFTHFLTSALRGAADDNDDGQVSLSEAYGHAFAHTVAATIGTKGGIQHPTYRFDLRGSGDVVLTRLAAPPSAIVFGAELMGSFVIFDLGRRVVVAELDKSEARPVRIGVRPGDYVVKKREADHVALQRLTLDRGRVGYVDPSRMEKVAFADDYAKGAVVSVEDVLHGGVGVRLSGVFGAQAFLSTPVSREYFPPLGTFELRLDLDNLLRRYLGLRLDVGVGTSGEQRLALFDEYLGTFEYRVLVTQVTAGVSLTGTFPLTSFLTLGGQARLGFIAVTRSFVGADLPLQGFATLTPGIGLEAALALTDWLQLGLQSRLHYMFFDVDTPLHLAYADVGLSLTLVLK